MILINKTQKTMNGNRHQTNSKPHPRDKILLHHFHIVVHILDKYLNYFYRATPILLFSTLDLLLMLFLLVVDNF